MRSWQKCCWQSVPVELVQQAFPVGQTAFYSWSSAFTPNSLTQGSRVKSLDLCHLTDINFWELFCVVCTFGQFAVFSHLLKPHPLTYFHPHILQLQLNINKPTMCRRLSLHVGDNCSMFYSLWPSTITAIILPFPKSKTLQWYVHIYSSPSAIQFHTKPIQTSLCDSMWYLMEWKI